MRSLRAPMHPPTFPRRSKLAESVAMTQSNLRPRFGFSKRRAVSRKASLSGTASSFQQTTDLPWSRRASARPSCEPMQSPSGRMWPVTQKTRWGRIPSRMRSMIFGCGFIGGVRMFELLQDFEDAIALLDRTIELEAQLRRVLQDYRLADQSLDAFAVIMEFRQSLLFLIFVAKNTDVN